MKTTEIDARLQAAVNAKDILGASLALVQEGQIVFAKGYGVTAADGMGVAVDTDTLFAYGSISKVVCATMIMRLVEQGLLDLDRPLVDYLPRLSFSDEALGGRVTLRHVLSHTTGLPAAGRDYGPRGAGALQQVLEAELPHYAFLAAPGTLHLYANTVYCLAGYAAEVVTGRDYDGLVQELVLDPLGMNTTTFTPLSDVATRIALPHERDEDGLRPITQLPANDTGHPSGFAYGTATDLARLAIALMDEKQSQGNHFLSKRTLHEMRCEHGSRHMAGAAHPLAYISGGYGLGMMLGEYRNQHVLRHGGMALSYNCFYELLPESRSGFVLLTHSSEEGPLMELVAFLYDQLLGVPWRAIELLEAPPPFDAAGEEEKWPLYEGAYLNVEWGGLVSVRVEDGRLLMEQDGDRMPLTCIGPGRYYARATGGARLPLAFLADSPGSVQHIYLAGAPYHRLTIEQPPVDVTKLGAFAGSYQDPYNWNDEEMLHIQVEDSHLLIREGDGEWLVCDSLGDRAFRCDLGFFELETANDDGAPLVVWGKATRYVPLSSKVVSHRGKTGI